VKAAEAGCGTRAAQGNRLTTRCTGLSASAEHFATAEQVDQAHRITGRGQGLPCGKKLNQARLHSAHYKHCSRNDRARRGSEVCRAELSYCKVTARSRVVSTEHFRGAYASVGVRSFRCSILANGTSSKFSRTEIRHLCPAVKQSFTLVGANHDFVEKCRELDGREAEGRSICYPRCALLKRE